MEKKVNYSLKFQKGEGKKKKRKIGKNFYKDAFLNQLYQRFFL